MRACLRRVRKRWLPPPKLTISQWADSFRELSPEASASRGKWVTARAEYQRGPMDAASDPRVEKMVLMTSAQVGKTEILLNILGFYIHYDPCPIIFAQPSLEMAQAVSKDRVATMIRDTRCLTDLVAEVKGKDSGNTILHKTFPGGHLTLVGANSAASLSSRPVRLVLEDEIERYPTSAGSEGSPDKLIEVRATTFWNSKIIKVSTPVDQGGAIHRAFQESDQRFYHVPCPHCNHEQTLKWERVRWTGGTGSSCQPQTARYYCEHCDQGWTDAQRYRAVSRGRWIATAPFKGTAGFHLNAIYSTFMKLSKLVQEWSEAQNSPNDLKTFWNTRLGLPWADRGKVPDWQILKSRSEDRPLGVIPEERCLIITAGIDIQPDRAEMHVIGWGPRLENWTLDYHRLPGLPERDELRELIFERLRRRYRHPWGIEIPIARTAIDTGYATQSVYSWVRHLNSPALIAVKGYADNVEPIGVPRSADVTFHGKRIPTGVKWWPVGTNILKAELYGLLNIEPPPDPTSKCWPGYCHHPMMNDDWYQQIVAEQVQEKQDRRGFSSVEWVKKHPRNEVLDTWVYARACLAHLGVDRWTVAQWEQYGDSKRPETVPRLSLVMPSAPPPSPKPVDQTSSEAAPSRPVPTTYRPPPARVARGRRYFRSRFMES